MKITLHYLLLSAFLGSLGAGCDEAGDHDHPGNQTSKEVPPPKMIDGRQEKLIPGTRNREEESKED
jgi:hypothetical protein